ncbi:hypothetical protein GQ53DRAFT_751315 [Thozetella sp. PMI_491]|nr:hypothetical protein GQ53DRAFT_751315 [Thozetella sp. PMI_491]
MDSQVADISNSRPYHNPVGYDNHHKRAAPVSQLPPEIVLEIAQRLRFRDLKSLSLTSRQFASIALGERLAWMIFNLGNPENWSRVSSISQSPQILSCIR